MERDYILSLFSPVVQGTPAFLEDISDVALGWSRSRRDNGGSWLGTFTVEAELPVLLEWFNQRLGCHIEERSGGAQTWAGLIYDMELSVNGVKLWRSFEAMSNAVATRYALPGGGVATTAWVTNATSIAKYGRKEMVLGETYTSAANALDEANNYLEENSYPWARARGVTIGGSGRPSLAVAVAGYVYTMNWRYLEDTWDDEDDIETSVTVKDWLDDVLADTTYLPFLTKGVVAANTVSTLQYQGTPIRIWDWVQNLIKRGDGSNHRYWRCEVTPQRTINAGPKDVTVRYYLRDGRLTDADGTDLTDTPHQIAPGVIRNLEYPQATMESGSQLEDSRDVLVEEVAVDGNGVLSLQTRDVSAEEVYSERSLAWREDQMKWLAYMQGVWDEQRRQEAEDWEKDYQRRKAEWDAAHPGVPFPG